MLAQAAIAEAGVNVIAISGTEILSAYVGESERKLAELFRQARATAPCIIFVDQFEALARVRGHDSSEDQSADRVLSALLTELDGVSSSKESLVMLIGVTNRPELIDSAVKRPGRIDCVVQTSALTADECNLMLQSRLQLSGAQLPDSGVEDLAKKCSGLSGADIDNWVKEAAYSAIRESIAGSTQVSLTLKHLQTTLERLFPLRAASQHIEAFPFVFGSPPASLPSQGPPKFVL